MGKLEIINSMLALYGEYKVSPQCAARGCSTCDKAHIARNAHATPTVMNGASRVVCVHIYIIYTACSYTRISW